MKKITLTLLIFTSLSFLLTGQEGYYYFGPNTKPVDSKQVAVTAKEVIRRSGKKFIIRTHHKQGEDWVQTGKLKIRIQDEENMVIYRSTTGFFPEKIYREIKKTGPDLYTFTESTLNRVVRTGTSRKYLPLHLEGTITEYHPYGELKSRSEYRDNQLVSNENWLPDGSRYIDSVFYSVDQEPEYQMGDDFFKSYLLQSLSGSGIDLSQIEDEVVIGWVIMETGDISGTMALKGKSTQLNQFLVNTIETLPGYWTPALLNGSPVRYFMSIPLNFMQRNAKFQEVEFSGGVMHYNRY